MAILDELPEDVLIDILSRIPAKALIRSKSVSKHWYALFRNPNFISLHHTRAHLNYFGRLFHFRRLTNCHSSLSMSLITREPTSIQHLDLSFTRPHLKDFFDHHGSCNGLICLSDCSEIVICNPAIKEFRLLPPIPFTCGKCCGEHCTKIKIVPIPFHTGSGILGFGFDSKTNDYKVVRVATLFEPDLEPFDANDDDDDDDAADHKVQIYSMSTDSWKEIVAMVPNKYIKPCGIPCTSSDGVFFYWLCYNYSTNVPVVVALDTVEGSFKEISLPPGNFCECRTNVCLLNDSLALVALFKYGKLLEQWRVEVWLMDEYSVEGCWTKKYTIGSPSGLQIVVGFFPTNNALVMWFSRMQFVLYDLSTHDTKEYKLLPDLADSALLTHVFPYSESLVSVKRQVVLA